MNKRGEEKWLSIWWFFVLIVIAGAVVIGVLIFYSAKIDTRMLEAEVLAERLARCITDGPYVNTDFLSPDFDVFTSCKIEKSLFLQGSSYYIEISAKDLDGSSRRLQIIEGDSSLKSDCGIEKVVEAKKYAKCVEKKWLAFYNKDGKLEKIRMQVIAASNQAVKKVPIV